MKLVRKLRRRLKTATTLIGEVREHFRAGGISQSVDYCRQKASTIFYEHRNQKILPGATISAAFDREFGVDTTSIIGMLDLTVESPNYLLGTVYKATDPDRFNEALASLPIDQADYTFVDLGSGKGLVLLLASNHPFRKVIGVEFALELHQVAISNIEKYSSPQRRCGAVQSLHQDVTAFEFPRTPLVVYLYHPFEEALMKDVVARLEKAYNKYPRPLIVIYVQPKVREPWDDAKFLRIQADIPAQRLEGRNQPAYLIFASKEAAWV